MSSTQGDLKHLWVAVTRPTHQAAGLIKRIQDAGGRALPFPTIEIRPPHDVATLHSALGRLSQYDWLLFVSANAAEMGLKAMQEQAVPRPAAKIAAIGAKTAGVLRHLGWPVNLVPKPPYNSETLLAEPDLQQVRGLWVLIFRGEGGREHLRDTLLKRGAHVDYAECYSRGPTSIDPEILEHAWSRQQLDVIAVTSVEIPRQLITTVGTRNSARLVRTPLVVASERVAQAAREHGWSARVAVAANATDEAMLAALGSFRRQRQAGS